MAANHIGKTATFLFFKCYQDLYVAAAYSEELYEVKADEVMDKLLANVYKGKFQLTIPTYKSTTEMTPGDVSNTETVITTELPRVLTTHVVPLKKYAENISFEQFHLRKRKMDLRTILESDVSHIPNFNGKDDEITAQTRRFNKIKGSQGQENILREYYFWFENGTYIYIEKNRTISLMAQFVYETRYHLPYAQLLRKKYKRNVKYQLGYSFALLRTLKQQQMVLYSTMKNYHTTMMSLFAHLKLYEKVVKLDVDIKDLMKLIKHLDKVRQKRADALTTQKLTVPPRG